MSRPGKISRGVTLGRPPASNTGTNDTTARNRVTAVTRVAVSRMLGNLPVSKLRQSQAEARQWQEGLLILGSWTHSHQGLASGHRGRDGEVRVYAKENVSAH